MSAAIHSGGALLAAYLLGAVPFGLLLARLRGVDIRKVGSGNIGATNVFRSVSKPLGLLAFALDALKGYAPAAGFPALAARADGGAAAPAWLGLACGVAAIAGHTWPVWLRFRGGKGVATSAGVLLGVAPACVGVGALAWGALFLATRYVSVASVGAAVAVPAFAWWRHGRAEPALAAVLTVLGALVVVRHRSNLARLRAGTEHRFASGRRRPAGAAP